MRFVLLFCYVICLASCVSIPREAPELSQNLGVQLQELQQSHMALVHQFFENEREKINTFVNEEWLPVFTGNFFSDPIIENAWQQVVNAGNAEDRLEFIKRTVPEIQRQTNNQYQTLVVPLNQLEQRLTQAVQQKYVQAFETNQALTDYLYSASKVAENRQRYLDQIGVTQDKTTAVLNDTEALTTQLITGVETVQQAQEKTETYIQELKEILETFKTGK